MPRPTAARAWTGAAIVAVLAVIVAILALLAMQRVAAPPAGGPSSAVGVVPSDGPSEPTEEPTASALPTPIASASAPPPVSRADERYLAAGAEGVIWRGIAGSCEQEIPPVLERSTDDGATWVDVTPEYRGITQLVSVDDFAQDQADLVATVLDDDSEGDACDVRALRTFSDGAFWADYDDVLARSSFPAPDEAATVVTPAGAVQAPCSQPRSVRSGGGRLALVCDGRALEWDGGEWRDTGVPAAVAVALSEDAVFVAHAQAGCDGVQVSAVTGGHVLPLVCQPGADARSPLAMDVTTAIRMWAGDEMLAAPLPEGALG